MLGVWRCAAINSTVTTPAIASTSTGERPPYTSSNADVAQIYEGGQPGEDIPRDFARLSSGGAICTAIARLKPMVADTRAWPTVPEAAPRINTKWLSSRPSLRRGPQQPRHPRPARANPAGGAPPERWSARRGRHPPAISEPAPRYAQILLRSASPGRCSGLVDQKKRWMSPRQRIRIRLSTRCGRSSQRDGVGRWNRGDVMGPLARYSLLVDAD